MLVYLVSIITICLYLWLSVIAFRRWKSGQAIRRFAFVFFFGALWMAAAFLETFGEIVLHVRPDTLNVFYKVDFSVGPIIAFFVASFSFLFQQKEEKTISPRRELLLFVPVLLIIIGVLSNFFFVTNPATGKVIYKLSHYYIFFAFLVTYFLIIGGGNFIRHLRKSEGLQQLQLKYITTGYTFSIALILFLSFINAVFFSSNSPIFLWMANSSIIFVSLSAYAVLKYRLLGIRFLIRRSFITFVTLLLLFGFYGLIFFFLDSVLTIVIVVFSMPFLYPRALRIVRNIVQPSDEVARERIRNRVRSIAKTMDYQVLFRSFLENIQERIVVSSLRGLTLEADNGYHDQFPEKKNGRSYFKRDDSIIEYFRIQDRVIVRQEIPFLIEQASKEAKGQLAEIAKLLDNLGAEVAVLVGSKEVAPVVALLPSKRDQSAFTKEEIEFLRSITLDMSQGFENFFLYRHALRRAGVEV